VAWFRKKPVVIEAVQYDGTWESVNDWLTSLGFDEDDDGTDGGPSMWMEDGDLIIATLEGNHRANPNDWIIRGVQGEFYPCKPGIFEETYESAA